MEYQRPLWITWEKQVRNRSMSSRINAQLVELVVNGNKYKRYIVCISRTAIWLLRSRKSVIIVQNPSLVLCLQAIFFRFFLRYRVIVDAHNAGVFPLEGKNLFMQALANWINYKADLVVVTNDGLAAHVRNLGGQACILPDPLPDIRLDCPALTRGGGDQKRAAFICTWAADEPYLELFGAAELLPDVEFFVTGKSRGKEAAFGRKLPDNVRLTGFLPESEYEKLLLTSDIVIDLTTREDCLVCGAYEAVSVEKPFVLSDTKALRAHFRIGGEFVNNYAKDIAEGVARVFKNYEEHLKEIARLKSLLEAEWNDSVRFLLNFISN